MSRLEMLGYIGFYIFSSFLQCLQGFVRREKVYILNGVLLLYFRCYLVCSYLLMHLDRSYFK